MSSFFSGAIRFLGSPSVKVGVTTALIFTGLSAMKKNAETADQLDLHGKSKWRHMLLNSPSINDSMASQLAAARFELENPSPDKFTPQH